MQPTAIAVPAFCFALPAQRQTVPSATDPSSDHRHLYHMLQVSAVAPPLRRALRGVTVLPSSVIAGAPPATHAADPAQPPSAVFPYPPIQVLQTSQVSPVPPPVADAGSQSNVSWPVIIGITVAAMLCLCALLILVYMRAHQRLRSAQTSLLRLKSPSRATKWVTSGRWSAPATCPSPAPTPSTVPTTTSEPAFLVKKWLDTLTPHGDDSGDVPELPPPSPDASYFSPPAPQEALLASRSDDKLQNSSQMHNNPIYDIRPLGNDNPVFVVDARGGSRSMFRASASSSEHLQMTHVTPPRHTPCSSPSASMGLQQLSPARRVGASSGVDRGTAETLDLDNRRSSRSKPLWRLDSATRMPVKGAADDTTSLPLAHVRVPSRATA